MRLLSIVKTYSYKTEKEQKEHQIIMAGKGFRVWNIAMVCGELHVDYVNDSKLTNMISKSQETPIYDFMIGKNKRNQREFPLIEEASNGFID